METEKNIISSEAKLSAIAGVMFFAPFIKNKLKSDSSFSQEEKNFIEWYIKVWYANIFLLIIVLASAMTNIFIINWFLPWVTVVVGLIIFMISFLSIFLCSNDVGLWWPNESLKQKIQHKGQILKVYIPIINFSMRFSRDNYDFPYRWLKESIFLRTIFVFGTLLLKTYFWIWVLIFIILRIVLLLLNIDIIPISVKKAINWIFLCNPWEIMAYIFAPIVTKIKKSDYETVLQTKKLWYMQWQKFWIEIILQYVIFVGILFLLYRWIDISLYNIVLFIAIILWIFRVVIFYVYKHALLKIPILSEMLSLIFH